jgi:hypothetical protein
MIVSISGVYLFEYQVLILILYCLSDSRCVVAVFINFTMYIVLHAN